MSVATTLNKVIHTGNDVASEFAFTFKVFAQANLVVTRYTIADGTLDVLALTTDYTVTLTDSGAGGGKVTLVAGALSSAYKLVIERQLTIEQATDYIENADFNAETIETSLDRLTMICQQLKEQLDRMISGNITTDAGVIYTPPDYAVPTIGAGDALKILRAKATEDDYELKTMAQIVDIAGLSAKALCANADTVMIEDSADANAKKKVTVDDLLSVNIQTEKTTPAENDVILAEDSAASYAKKKIKISTLDRRQVFTASGSFTTPVGVTRVFITGCAGGGGGGGVLLVGRNGGGASGKGVAGYPITVTAETEYDVTVGAGGAGNTDGVDSVFEGLLTLKGGNKGLPEASGGAGGGSQPTEIGLSIAGLDDSDGGTGGSGMFGGGGLGDQTGAAGNATGYGAGGGGGADTKAGGAGTVGFIIVEY